MAEPVDVPVATKAVSTATLSIPYASAAVAAYQSPRPLARLLIGALWAGVALQLMMLWPTVGTLAARLSVKSEGREFDPVLIGAARWIQVVLYLVSMTVLVLWATWVHRTYCNLGPLGASGLTYSPRWVVAYIFIPGVHLLRPFQVTRETWRASDPHHGGGTRWRDGPSPVLVNAWWAVYLLATVAFLATLLLDTEGNENQRLIAAACAGTAAALLQVASCVMAIRIVGRMTAMQDERAGRVGTMPQPGEERVVG